LDQTINDALQADFDLDVTIDNKTQRVRYLACRQALTVMRHHLDYGQRFRADQVGGPGRGQAHNGCGFTLPMPQCQGIGGEVRFHAKDCDGSDRSLRPHTRTCRARGPRM